MSDSGGRRGISRSVAGLAGRREGSCLGVGEGKIKGGDVGPLATSFNALSAHWFWPDQRRRPIVLRRRSCSQSLVESRFHRRRGVRHDPARR